MRHYAIPDARIRLRDYVILAIIGNIKVVSYRANRIKSDSVVEELELIAKAVRNHLDEQKTPIPTVE